MKLKIPKFRFSLMINYILSTLIPFIIITFLIASIYQYNYTRDIFQLVDTSLISLTQNIDVYLSELDRATLMPYYNEDFFSILKKIKHNPSTSSLDYRNLENSIGYLMSFIRYTREDIVSSVIVSDNRCLYNTSSISEGDIDADYKFSQEDWYQEAVSLRGEAVFIPPHTLPYYLPEKSTEVVSIARAIINLRTREPLCVMKVDANTVIFDKIFNRMNFHVPSRILLTDSQNRLIYSNTDVSYLQLKDQLNSNVLSYDQTDYVVHQKTTDSYGWNVYVLLDAAALRHNTIYIYITAVSLYLLGAVLAFILYLIRNRHMIQAVETANTMLLEIQNGNLHPSHAYYNKDEFRYWIDSISQIACLLDEKMQREYQLTIEQKTYRFKALQAQIHPHFLFNTLNSFIALNQLGKQNELERALYALTNMLRYSLGDSEHATLEQELSFLQDYCSLQKLRFGRRFNYSIEYDPALGQTVIPKLLIQPLAENAVIHGIEPLHRPCCLTIGIIPINSLDILITIEDDGAGFDTAHAQRHIGIDNVKKRLELLNPKNKLEIESTPEEGTVVTILLHAEEEEKTI